MGPIYTYQIQLCLCILKYHNSVISTVNCIHHFKRYTNLNVHVMFSTDKLLFNNIVFLLVISQYCEAEQMFISRLACWMIYKSAL